MVITTQPNLVTARGTKLKPVQHSPVFREYNVSQRSSTGVKCSQYMSQSALIFSEFYFVIPGSRNQFDQKIAFCGLKLFDLAGTKNPQIIFLKLYL